MKGRRRGEEEGAGTSQEVKAAEYIFSIDIHLPVSAKVQLPSFIRHHLFTERFHKPFVRDGTDFQSLQSMLPGYV